MGRVYIIDGCNLEYGMITLTVNGKQQSFESEKTIRTLLEELGLANKRLAVEVQGVIVPRSEHADFNLVNGSSIEIIEAIGGG